MGSIAARRFSRSLLATTALTGLGALLAPGAVSAGQLPTGYATAYGAVGFQRQSGTLTINQGTPAAVVNYNSFSIGRRNRVNIHQPNVSSVLLNRVTGTTTSVIAGRLSANGQVYLVNPNGIAITKSGVVKVGGGFVASSLAISDEDFIDGRRGFAGTGRSARVSNAGTITIGRRGYAALIGGEVRNTGTIAVPMGTVALGSGEMATLDVSGDGFMQVAVPTAAAARGALITDTGRISGVTVMVDAATARAAARNAVNISGRIDSHTISGHGGTIQIGGGDGGAVAVSGRLSVASRRGRGGAVTVTGAQIALTRARVQAQGARGGGIVRIGGDLHGGGTLPHAGTVTVDARSVIDADATRSGNGGSVVVWSDGATSFAGTISAKGGPLGGNGGTAEVSSAGTLGYTGTAILTAPHGATGTLLLDPYDVTIASAADSNTSLAAGTYTPAGTSVISNTELEGQLGSANVTITTGAAGSSPGTDAGNITVAAPVTWSASTTLTLTANNNISINAPIALGGMTGAGFALSASNALFIGAPITVNGVGAVAIKYNSALSTNLSFGLTSSGFMGSISYRNADETSATMSAGGTLTINGQNYALIYNIGDLVGLSGGNNALATSLTAGSYQGAGGGPFGGALNGLGNTISNLKIDDSNAFGVFASNNGIIANIGFTNLQLHGGGNYSSIGGLVGDNSGIISSTYISGAIISSAANIGGLVGSNSGTVTNSYAIGSIMGGWNAVGGLIAYNSGTINLSNAVENIEASSYYAGGLIGDANSGFIYQSYAAGTLDNSRTYSSDGGLVGVTEKYSQISQSYAIGRVAGSYIVGGLIGNNGGAVTQSYSTVFVSGGIQQGGLVGENDGTVAASYWDVATTGQTNGYGVKYSGNFSATGVTTANLASAAVLSTLNESGAVFGNAGNQTTPYLLGNPGPVYLGTDASTTPTAYIPILSIAGLQAINGNLTGNYVLAQNIDATGVTGFTPIGESTAYTGTFNGLGNTISNLTISTNAQYAGLFGQVGLGGTVKNVGLIGGSVTGPVDNAQVGALVGFNNGGTITQAYATGAVSGGANALAGGLVGGNGGTIMQAYATGTVSDRDSPAGGLVGGNYGGTITQAYATGAVSGGGSAYVGGLVGRIKNSTMITASTFDTQTTGQSAGIGGMGASQSGVTALTTAQLQSIATANPFGTNSGFAGGAAGGTQNGVYPYLTSFFPNGVQAVSGFAYKDGGATPAASGAAGAVTVSLDANGGQVAQATTGANGYYYAFVPAGTAAAGSSLLVSTAANATTGATSSATLSTFAGSSGNTGSVNLYGNAVTVPTTAISLSLAQSQQSQQTAQASATTAAGTDRTAAAAVAATTDLGFVATGASFTIDQPVTTSSTFVVQTAAGAPLTVAQPVTIQPGGSLGLLSGGALAVDAPVMARGAATVALGAATSTVPGTTTSVLDLAFAQGDAITFTNPDGSPATGPVAGQALSINGTPYTLVYSMAELDAIDGTSATGSANPTMYGPGLGGAYALAADLAAAGTTYTDALVAGSNGAPSFSGRFEGLGHTLLNLTIVSTNGYVGLFGSLSGARVADLSIEGSSVTGFRRIGLLAGLATSSTISSVSVAESATSIGQNGSGGGVGGLVGDAEQSTIVQSSANATITGSQGAGGTNGGLGGLVGTQAGGLIDRSYALGAVQGAENVGGLVGLSSNGAVISNSFAMGAVSGGNFYTGGLVGQLFPGSSVSNSFSTGSVRGVSAVGGLVGQNTGGSTSNSYWDISTSGQATDGAGAVGLTTSQLQGTTALPANVTFALGNAFAGGAAGGTQNGVYPYLTSFFPNGVQAVSGFAYKDAGLTPLASPATSNGLPATQRPGYVTVTAGTTTLATVTTGANGYYYTAVAAGSLPAGINVAGSTTADTGTNGSGAVNAVSFTNSQSAAANIPGLNVYGGYASAGSYDAKLADAIADYPASLQAAEAADPTVKTLAPGLAPGYLALGPSFALDAQPAAGALVAGGTGFAITAATTITGSLTLAAPSIAFDAPVTVNGGQLILNTNAAGTLTFAAPLQYNPTGANQSLTIEGIAYNLITNEAQLLGLNGKGNGTYDALAASFTSTSATGTPYMAAPIANYAGTLEGLGNTITGLTIDAPAGSTNVGLVGTLGTGGTLRDIGLVGGSVQGGGNPFRHARRLKCRSDRQCLCDRQRERKRSFERRRSCRI